MKIYFAGPLFSEADRDWTRKTIKEIENLARECGEEVTIIFPYDLITIDELERLGDEAKYEIFSRCKSHIEDAHIVIALLDGTQVDDGTAWEIGYFYRGRAEGSLIIGIRTDFRNAGESGTSVVNAMIECSCDWIARSTEELLKILSESIKKIEEFR
jgi:nucleoside 2-deoxyribosyltransferase